jgi:hypothetical protein
MAARTAARFTAGEIVGAAWLEPGGSVPLVVPPATVVDVVLDGVAVVEEVGVEVEVVELPVVEVPIVELAVVEVAVVELPVVKLPVDGVLVEDGSGVALATAPDATAPSTAARAAPSASHALRRTRRARLPTPKGWPFPALSGNRPRPYFAPRRRPGASEE